MDPLIAIVGDTNPARTYDPPMHDAALASKAAEELGVELCKRGARLLVYGGPFVEADVVRGYVSGKPDKDHRIIMWYTRTQEPPPFAEEATHPKLFERRAEQGADWETAFYRSIGRADGVILIGGGKATLISGQLAIGLGMPLMALASFGGGASRVWDTLQAGADLPTRDEINQMQRPWGAGAAIDTVKALFAQVTRRGMAHGAPKRSMALFALALFILGAALVPLIWGKNEFAMWMLFLAPLLVGGAGAAVRSMVDVNRAQTKVSTLTTIIMGVIAGGIASVLFVTAQLTADPTLLDDGNVVAYARRSLPFALSVGFVAGMTAKAVFGKLLGLDVTRTSGIGNTPQQP